MKRINNIFDSLLNVETIKEIILDAAKGKKSRKEVQTVLGNIDIYAEKIVRMLQTGEYELKPTRDIYITEWVKPRLISISPFFPNRILDHICVHVLKPHIRKSMYEYCIGNVDNRGITFGKRIINQKYHKYKYHVKLDIKKFYPSTSSEDMYNFLTTKIKDKRFLGLCKAVLSQHDSLPIGAYYSQWLSNYYLESLDHYIKQELKVPFYMRYVDDMLLMGNNKKQLKNACWKIKKYLAENKHLTLKAYGEVRELDKNPIDFLGFRFRTDGVYLRTRIFKKMNKIVKKIRQNHHVTNKQAMSLMSYLGWLKQLKQGNLYYQKYIKPTVKKGYIRRIISTNAKKQARVKSLEMAQALKKLHDEIKSKFY